MYVYGLGRLFDTQHLLEVLRYSVHTFRWCGHFFNECMQHYVNTT